MADIKNLVLGIDARRARTGADEFKKATERAAGGARKLDKATTKAEQTTRRFGNAAEKTGKQSSQAASGIKRMALGFSAIIAARQVIRVLAGFEETMQRVRAITGATELQMRAFTATAREMGAKTRFSASQAGDGLLFLSKAGFKVHESIAALPAALNLALAATIELGQSADILSNIMSQFEIPAERASDVVDTLANVARSSNVSIVQLSESFKFVGPLARAAGLSLQETAAALGVLGNSGIQATLAGTQLRGNLLALLAPTDSMKAKMEAAGVSVENLGQDLLQALKAVKAGNLGFGESVAIAGRRFASGLQVMSRGTATYEELLKIVEENKGAGQDFADTIDDSLIGSFKGLVSATEELILKQGDQGLLGVMRGLVDVSAQTVRILAGVESTTQSMGAVAFTAASAIRLLVTTWIAMKALKLIKWLKAKRVAMIANIAVERAAAVQTNLFAAQTAALAGTQVAATVSTTSLAVAIRTLTATMAQNPIAMIGLAIGVAATAWFTYQGSVERAARAQRDLNDSIETNLDLLAQQMASTQQSSLLRRLNAEEAAVARLKKTMTDLFKVGDRDTVFGKADDIKNQILFRNLGIDPKVTRRETPVAASGRDAVGERKEAFVVVEQVILAGDLHDALEKVLKVREEILKKVKADFEIAKEKRRLKEAEAKFIGPPRPTAEMFGPPAATDKQRAEQAAAATAAAAAAAKAAAAAAAREKKKAATDAEKLAEAEQRRIEELAEAERRRAENLKHAKREQAQMNTVLRTQLDLGKEAAVTQGIRFEAEDAARRLGFEGNESVIRSLQLQIDLERELIGEIDAKAAAVAKAAAEKRDGDEKAKQTTDILISKQQQYASAVISSFRAALQSGANFGQILRGLIEQIAFMIIQEQILGAIRSAGLAKGTSKGGLIVDTGPTSGVSKGGLVERFSAGGFPGLPDIITTPMARVSAGTIQTFGENVRPGGEEAVLPLKRDASGQLGVQAHGGATGLGARPDQRTQHFNIVFNDRARDTDDFRRNQRQLKRQLQSMTNSGSA